VGGTPCGFTVFDLGIVHAWFVPRGSLRTEMPLVRSEDGGGAESVRGWVSPFMMEVI